MSFPLATNAVSGLYVLVSELYNKAEKRLVEKHNNATRKPYYHPILAVLDKPLQRS